MTPLEANARWSASPADAVLPAAEIHVFAFDLDVPEPLLQTLGLVLSEDELTRAARFRLGQDRRRYIAGRGRLRTILGRYMKREAADVHFRYGSHGKPALGGRSDGERIQFNMSRSGDLGVVAILLDDDIGIDIERLRPFPDALEIAARLFAAEEHRALLSVPAAERSAAFFRYWTRKEAVVKSLGRGLSYPMDGFTLSQDPGESPERLEAQGEDGTLTRWSLPVPEPRTGYVTALATAGSPRPLRCWTWVDR